MNQVLCTVLYYSTAAYNIVEKSAMKGIVCRDRSRYSLIRIFCIKGIGAEIFSDFYIPPSSWNPKKVSQRLLVY